MKFNKLLRILSKEYVPLQVFQNAHEEAHSLCARLRSNGSWEDNNRREIQLYTLKKTKQKIMSKTDDYLFVRQLKKFFKNIEYSNTHIFSSIEAQGMGRLAQIVRIIFRDVHDNIYEVVFRLKGEGNFVYIQYLDKNEWMEVKSTEQIAIHISNLNPIVR